MLLLMALLMAGIINLLSNQCIYLIVTTIYYRYICYILVHFLTLYTFCKSILKNMEKMLYIKLHFHSSLLFIINEHSSFTTKFTMHQQ